MQFGRGEGDDATDYSSKESKRILRNIDGKEVSKTIQIAEQAPTECV